MKPRRTSKRQAPGSPESSAKRANVVQFANEARIGEEDLFSLLPQDCITAALSYTAPKDVEQIETASQKMCNIVRTATWNHPKKRMHMYKIEPKSRGYRIIAVPFEYKKTRELTLAMNDSGKKTQFFGLNTNIKVWRKRTEDIPEIIYGAIEELNVKHAPAKLSLKSIFLDDSVIRKLDSAFRGKLPKELELTHVRVAPSSLKNFILRSKIVHLHVDTRKNTFGSVRSYDYTLNEEFVRDFYAAGGRMLCHKSADARRLVNRWRPSRGLLEIICGYRELHLRQLNLTADLLCELILAAFKVKQAVKLTCSFDGQLLLSDLTPQFTVAPFSIHRSTLDLREFLIKESADPHHRVQSAVKFNQVPATGEFNFRFGMMRVNANVQSTAE